MSDGLKPGWRRVKFGEVVRLSKESSKNPAADGLERYVGLEHIEPGDLRIRSWGNIADGTTFIKRFRPGQVLFGKRRAYQRKVAVADFEGVCSGDIYVFDPKDSEALLPELLPFICQTDTFFSHAVGTSAGSLSPRTNWKSLAEYEFMLPPLEDQQRLCRVLTLLEGTIERNRSVLDELVRVRISTLTHWQEDWETQYGLRKIVDLLREQPRNGLSPPAVETVTPLKTVSISSVRDGRFSPDGCIKYVEVSQERAESFLVQKADVLVVRGNGNRLLTGQAGFAGTDYHDTFYPDLLIRLRFDQNILNAKFATSIWNSPRTHARLISRAKSTNGIWKINGQDIRSHSLSVPPKQVQQECLAVLDSITLNEEACAQRLRVFQTQKRFVLRRLEGIEE